MSGVVLSFVGVTQARGGVIVDSGALSGSAFFSLPFGG